MTQKNQHFPKIIATRRCEMKTCRDFENCYACFCNFLPIKILYYYGIRKPPIMQDIRLMSSRVNHPPKQHPHWLGYNIRVASVFGCRHHPRTSRASFVFLDLATARRADPSPPIFSQPSRIPSPPIFHGLVKLSEVLKKKRQDRVHVPFNLQMGRPCLRI